MSSSTYSVVICRDCGARNAPGTARCWLCSAGLPPSAPSLPIPGDLEPSELQPEPHEQATGQTDDEWAEAELVPERPHASRMSYSLTTIFAAMTIVALAAGFFRDGSEWGLGILVLLVGLPALLITTIRMGRLRAKGRDVTWTNRILTFVLSSLAMVSVVVLLTLASILALFIYCLVVCGASGKLF